jgi:hypothetical protein
MHSRQMWYKQLPDPCLESPRALGPTRGPAVSKAPRLRGIVRWLFQQILVAFEILFPVTIPNAGAFKYVFHSMVCGPSPTQGMQNKNRPVLLRGPWLPGVLRVTRDCHRRKQPKHFLQGKPENTHTFYRWGRGSTNTRRMPHVFS